LLRCFLVQANNVANTLPFPTDFPFRYLHIDLPLRTAPRNLAAAMVCSMSSKALAILIVCIFINYTVADQSAAGGSTSLSTITTGPSIAPTPSPTTPSSSTGDASDNSPGSTGSQSGGGGAATTALSDASSVSATATMSSIMVTSSGLAPSPAVNNSSNFNCKT
jgi:hypothetical protein